MMCVCRFLSFGVVEWAGTGECDIDIDSLLIYLKRGCVRESEVVNAENSDWEM